MATPAITPELIRNEANKLLQRRAIMGALGAGGVAAGTAFGLRSMNALLSQSRRNLSPRRYSSPLASIVSMPVTHEDEEQQKLAGWLSDFMKGNKATTVSGIPWAIPAAAAAIPTGAYVGYNIADWLADKQRMGELDSELADEKKQFRDALIVRKPEAKTKLARALCRLEELVEKRASQPVKKANTLNDLLGTWTGLYGAYAGTAGLIGGKAMFDMVRKDQRGPMLQEALKRRRILMAQARPAPIVISDGKEESNE